MLKNYWIRPKINYRVIRLAINLWIKFDTDKFKVILNNQTYDIGLEKLRLVF